MSNDHLERERRVFSGPEVRFDIKDARTATDAIRAHTWSRWRRGNFAGLARDLQVSIADLEAFVKGQKPRLADSVMHALVKEFYHHTRFDPENDQLIDIAPPPLPAGKLPEPYVNPDPVIAKATADYRAALAAAQPPPTMRSRPAQPAQEKAGRFSPRPGFAT
jgi:hypothetical protein